MKKYFILFIIVLFCLSSISAQDDSTEKVDYNKITKTLNILYKHTDKFVSEINNAKNAKQIIKAFNKFTKQIEKIKSELKEINTKYSYLFSNAELSDEIPNDLKDIINKLKKLGESEEMKNSFNKIEEWKAKDEKVKEAASKFENILND